MALDFPANPTNGQVYDSYVYNSTVGAWQSREDSRTVAILSSTAPTSANPGDIWVNTNDGISFVYYDDGTSAQWMEILPSGVPLLDTKADLTYVDSQDALKANIASPTFTGVVTAPRFTSTQATGTAPFTVSSTTVVANLNADMLDGNHSSAFSPVAGSSSITAVGTITSGVWNGSTIAVANGGTGATTLASGGYLKGAGTGAITSQTGIPAEDITSGQLSRSRLPSGSVLQVLSKSDTVDYSAGVSQNTWITWPGSRMNLSITPTSTSSKVLVIVNADLGNSSNDAGFRILRNGSVIGVGGSYSGKQQASGVTGMLYATDANHTRRVVTVSYLDSPGSTSAVSYDIQFSSEGTTMYINRAPAPSYQNGTYMFAATGVSTITLMEVAG